MLCISLIHWGNSKEARIFWGSSWESPTSRIFPSSCHQLGVLTACPLHSTHLSCSSAGGSGGKLLPPSSSDSLAGSWQKHSTSHPSSSGGPSSNSMKGSSASLSSNWGGYARGNGQGYPLVRPCGTSCSAPRTYSSIGCNSGNGHRCLDSLW